MPYYLENNMDIRRFYTEHPIKNDTLILSGAEFLHCTKVTRHKIGYKIIVSNGDGYDYHATITDISKDMLTAKIDSRLKNETELPYQLSLFVGIGKELDFLVQKAVELGVTNIVPVITNRSLKTINISRLESIIIESAKQCTRAKLPQITNPIPLTTAISDCKAVNKIVCYEKATNNLLSALSPTIADTAIIIGAEGGLEESEIKACVEHGFVVASLGKRVLRAETAAISALSILLSITEEM